MKKKEKRGCLIVAGVFLLLVVVIVSVTFLADRENAKTETKSEQTQGRTLKAAVNFDGSQFIIRNNDSFDWTNVRFKLNSGIIRDGYTLKVNRIEAKTTYRVGALQFSESDGTRFNPFTMKPKTIFIFAQEGDKDLYWE